MQQIEPGRNLVVCCDGTGNLWRPGDHKTNVVKLVEALIRDPQRQMHFYDPGVGTPDGYISDSGQAWRDWMRRIGGLVWGDGAWSNVADAYAFLVENYRPQDRIFLFGFSRGAFTARAVSGLVYLFGILHRENINLIPTLLSVYRTEPGLKKKSWRRKSTSNPRPTREAVGQSIKQAFSLDIEVPIHFIGVWDTVESVGMDQLALGTHITSSPDVRPIFRHVRHALALDELRWPYRPRLYKIPEELPEGHSAKQVWFAGVHSDVGGGYAQSGLANASLHWMLREANAHGLLLDFNELDTHRINALDTLHDEVAHLPVWTAVGTFLRSYPAQMCVHESVVERMQNAQTKYRPQLRADYGTEFTATGIFDLHGIPLTRALPLVAPAVVANPPNDRTGVWFWLWLLISGTTTIWGFSRDYENQFRLAQAQFFDGWRGRLGDVLSTWHSTSGASIGKLLCNDTLTIVFYASLLPALAFLLQRLAQRNGAIGSVLGKFFLYSGLLLPLSDVGENFLTALNTTDFAHVHPLFAIGCSVLTGLASTTKFLALLAFLGAAVVCIAKFFRRAFAT
ncbi:DUF2235 domain-containing protein [Pseudolysobacter antarcticus]|uniref:DUF2235 domain-containing protein n=1 Tax=Pseudolysobacter antarcticus TaxID=2511995 RepID=A0A411HER1_9GAMM|nr:DUF2235 domain-containing protein [Pseudolysobacter antarcticus]QBB68976.1 DUF2235 domain-containing protein [Pseudolysobacter antarcticus]